jgi:hypothetical protein
MAVRVSDERRKPAMHRMVAKASIYQEFCKKKLLASTALVFVG